MKAVLWGLAVIALVIAAFGLFISDATVKHLADFIALGFVGLATFIASFFVP